MASDLGETLAIVGESGCGKSVSALSIMGLLAKPAGKILGGRVLFNGADLLTYSNSEMRRIRGREIAMVFQEPMTSLNPLLTIGRQLTESLELHMGMDAAQARTRVIELMDMVEINGRPAQTQPVPAPPERRHASAGDARVGALVPPQGDHRRRAHHGPRRNDTGADPRTDEESPRTNSAWR